MQSLGMIVTFGKFETVKAFKTSAAPFRWHERYWQTITLRLFRVLTVLNNSLESLELDTMKSFICLTQEPIEKDDQLIHS
jgi:hypothetical protein